MLSGSVSSLKADHQDGPTLGPDSPHGPQLLPASPPQWPDLSRQTGSGSSSQPPAQKPSIPAQKGSVRSDSDPQPSVRILIQSKRTRLGLHCLQKCT